MSSPTRHLFVQLDPKLANATDAPLLVVRRGPCTKLPSTLAQAQAHAHLHEENEVGEITPGKRLTRKNAIELQRLLSQIDAIIARRAESARDASAVLEAVNERSTNV